MQHKQDETIYKFAHELIFELTKANLNIDKETKNKIQNIIVDKLNNDLKILYGTK